MNDYDEIVIGCGVAALEVNSPNYATAIVTTNEVVDSHGSGPVLPMPQRRHQAKIDERVLAKR